LKSAATLTEGPCSSSRIGTLIGCLHSFAALAVRRFYARSAGLGNAPMRGLTEACMSTMVDS
jgi:hypothetical protein